MKGQSLANDDGQKNATGDKALMEAAAFEDTHVMRVCQPVPSNKRFGIR